MPAGVFCFGFSFDKNPNFDILKIFANSCESSDKSLFYGTPEIRHLNNKQ